MENKEIIIIALILVAIYLYYQQNNQIIQPVENNNQLQELKNQVQHYQKLYQDRVKKDLAGNQEKEIQQLNQQLAQTSQDYQETYEELTQVKEYNQAYQEKIAALETQLLSLAQQKIKGKKEAQRLLTDLETQ